MINHLLNIFLLFDSIPGQYKTQEMSDIVPSVDSFLTVYCLDKCKTRRMCDEAVDDSLAALRFIPYWFVTSKTIKELYTPLYADENVLHFNEDSGNAIVFCNKMGNIVYI